MNNQQENKVRVPIIQVSNLYKIYCVGDTRVRALNGVDFEIYKGEFCAIVGTSGSGKSTLLNLSLIHISPVHIGEDVIHSPYASFDAESPEKSKALAKFYEEVARQYDCLYLDASETAVCSSLDQLHMDEENHKKLAKAVKEVIEEYFSDRAGDK